MTESFQPPAHTLGADLFWWRETGAVHTLVSIFWGSYPTCDDAVTLTFALFDADRACVASWCRQVSRDEPIFVDSADPPEALRDAPPVADGVLAVFSSTATPPSTRLRAEYLRLYGLIDWYSEDGLICSLHTDQSVLEGRPEHRFTEIVVEESDTKTSFLVILNGPQPYGPASVELDIRNHHGETRHVVFRPALEPFSVNRLELRQLVPDVARFANGRPLTIGGRHTATGLFIRPYVMTSGRFRSGYHGGDVYEDNDGVPGYEQRFLDRGLTNPMFAVHRAEVTTTVNLFNSHGVIDDDFWVDLYLYDETARLAAEFPRWQLARRGSLTRGDIATALPDGGPFTGHMVLAFSRDDDKPLYPDVLQALVEYRTAVNTSRVAVWSDEWNSPGRARLRGQVSYRAFFRVWCRPPLETTICVSNSANERRYDEAAPYTAVLINGAGHRQSCTRVVPPHGTDHRAVVELFPDAERFLAPSGFGMLILESDFDLAEIQMTRHAGSGAIAAEHFMALPSVSNGQSLWPSGA